MKYSVPKQTQYNGAVPSIIRYYRINLIKFGIQNHLVSFGVKSYHCLSVGLYAYVDVLHKQ